MPTLTVTPTHQRNAKGQFILVIYDSESRWLDEDTNAPAKVVKQKLSDGASLATDLPAGTYGFLVLHDENMNDELDRGLVLPKEGLAVSNDAKMSLKGPKWKNAKFQLDADTAMRVRLKYWG
jgi:uncharacterized protein (DUF2141 family)